MAAVEKEPAAPVAVEQKEEGLLLLAPLSAASIWRLGKDVTPDSTGFESGNIAKNPADTSADRPVFSSVYFGVPPKSATSVISLGTMAMDADRFVSTTSFHETGYTTTFGFFGFDKDSLSAGVSRKFSQNIVTSLYYNGNIVEDIFAYISNNSLTNGSVGVGSTYGWNSDLETVDTNYDFIGDLKDRNNINNQTNIDLLFGVGVFGVTAGYSQKLFGQVKKSNAEPKKNSDGNYIIYDTQEALLDNALAPHIEFGFHFDTSAVSIRTALAFQIDIHNRRELSKGHEYNLGAVSPPLAGTYETSSSTEKLSADYREPAVAFRIEADFPSERSRLGLGLESGMRLRTYSNMDDRGSFVNGIFWSKNSTTTTSNTYEYSVTTKDFDVELLARPSVRYLVRMGARLKTGINAGFGVGFKFGSQETKSYKIDGTSTAPAYAEYLKMKEDDVYADANLKETTTTTPGIDLGLYPNLGVGFSYEVAPGVFVLNGGIGGAQTLYRLRTGEVEIVVDPNDPSKNTKTPLLEQSWGKPLAQFALGAIFMFKEHFALDTMFSSNGTSFDNANFVVQFSARF